MSHCNYLIYTLHVFNNFIFNIWLFVSSKPWQDVGEPHVDFYCIHSASNITRFKCLLNENNEITFYVHWMSFISIFIFSSWTYVKHIVSMKTKRNINSTQYQLIQIRIGNFCITLYFVWITLLPWLYLKRLNVIVNTFREHVYQRNEYFMNIYDVAT